jgi:two-component system cell cycle sensor histidine kinase/response regulator CckA
VRAPAPGGVEALDVVGRLALLDGGLRLVVTDLAISKMGGRELAERLAALRSGVPVLFMSGYADGEVARRGLLAVGQDLLQKPFSPDTLAERVRQIGL